MVVLAAQSTAALAEGFVDCVSPYIGADVAWRYQGFQKNLGGNLSKRNFLQGDVYAGLKFFDYVGLQIGFEGSPSQHRTTNFSGPFIVNGITENIPGLNQFQTATQIYGWHLDLVGFIPFCVCDEHFELIGSVGVIRNRFRFRSYPAFVNDTPTTATQIASNTLTFATSKYVARLGLGLQYYVTECAGVRFMAGWENTSRFNQIAPQNRFLPSRTTLRNATTLGIGVFYNF